jgi:tetratricopeptide (TPR) repeat protein
MSMTARRPTMAATLLLVLGCCVTRAYSAGQTTRELRARAADLSYNLDHDEALTLLRQAVAADPGDSVNHRVLASALLLDILFRRGAVTVDHYLGSLTNAKVQMNRPPPELDAEFRREIAKAIELAERKTAAAPSDPQAHFDLGTAVGLQATYIASVDGRLLAGFRAAKRSYEEQEMVLELDPTRKDAQLIVGTYRYIVSTLSLPMRLMAYVAGFSGGKDLGLKMIEEAAAAPGENRTDAQFALVLLYNREHQYDAAMRVLKELRRQYPRNRLVLLEAGATATRAGRAAEADALLTEGITALAVDRRPRIPGEEALWHYKRGTARVMLGRREKALADLRAALVPEAAGWVQGRAHVELARLAKQQGDKAGARREAEAAAALCETNGDPICVADAKKLK